MEGKETKPKQELSCMQHGPGPVYKLGNLTGYIGHDPSHRREPAYSMTFSKKKSYFGDGPGPKYNVSGFTNHGPEYSPAFSISGKRVRKNEGGGPSPLDYKAEKCSFVNHTKRPPAYSIQFRDFKKVDDDGPGPIYLLPTCLGPNLIDKKAQGAFTMGIPTKRERWDDLPGPGAYRADNYDLIKRRYPAYSMKFRTKDLLKWNGGPGPKYKSEFPSGKRPPMYSFGVRHSQCAGTWVSEADNE